MLWADVKATACRQSPHVERVRSGQENLRWKNVASDSHYEKLAVNPQDHLYHQLISDISTMSLTVVVGL